MNKLQKKKLSELFAIGIELNAQEKSALVAKVRIFSSEKADELVRMFSVNPSELGLNSTTSELHKFQHQTKGQEIPDTIGQFKILSILGAGGMGIVYLGKREDINQLVAVKVSNSILPLGTRAQAITHEAKILASLHHPNIASVVDWGTFGNQGHYVAIEYVDGLSIDDYCRKHRLSIPNRVKLFIEVIEAVDYAHSNLVIHRDLKPDNILVDDSGVPVLLDFGIARLMESESGLHQQTQGAAHTPSFASPEQLCGDALSIRSDIYSLGAVLFNLLTEKQFNANKEIQTAYPNIEKILQTKYSQSQKSNIWLSINKQKLKDLTLVISKALSYDQNQRYHNTLEFKQDLQAILEVRPIKARAPSKWYKFRKFIARNRIATTIFSIALLSTIIATGFGAWQWNEAVNQKVKAIETSDDMFNYSKFLETTLAGMNVYEGGSADITMDKFMERAVKLFKNETKVSPKQLSYHAHVLSKIYNSWGNLENSLDVLNIGLGYARKSKSPGHIATMLGQTAVIYYNQTKYLKCIDSLDEALIISKNHPKKNTQKQGNLVQLSLCYSAIGKYTESMEIALKVINDKESTRLNIAYASYSIANAHLVFYEIDESVHYFTKAETLFSELFGKDSGMAISMQAMRNHSEALQDPENYNIEEQQKVIEISNKTYGKTHPNTAEFIGMMATTYYLKNQLKQAIELQKSVVEIMEVFKMSFYIVKCKLQLVKLNLLDNNKETAKTIFYSISKETLVKANNNSVNEQYQSILAWLFIETGDLTNAQKSLFKAKEYQTSNALNETSIEIEFRAAQLLGLEKNYQGCYDNAKKATEYAEKFYPKTWQLPNAYRYLQDVCQQKLNGTNENDFPYLDNVLQSPWKQETVIITKILNKN